MNTERLHRLPSYRAVQEAKKREEEARRHIKGNRFGVLRPWGAKPDEFEVNDHKLVKPEQPAQPTNSTQVHA